MVKECMLPINPVLSAVAYATLPGLFIANATYRLRLGLPNTVHTLQAAAVKKCLLPKTPYLQLFAPQTIPECPAATLKIWRQSPFCSRVISGHTNKQTTLYIDKQMV